MSNLQTDDIGLNSPHGASKRVKIPFYPQLIEKPDRLASKARIVIIRVSVDGDASSLDWL